LVHWLFVRRDVERILHYRHHQLQVIFHSTAAGAERGGGATPGGA
jgi:hypothetical protein